jgi:ABC-type transport system involved in multi-copper enzyme maturation permease subunit
LSPAVEIRLLVARELRRSVRSVKGIVLGLITLLGAVVTSVVVVWLEGLNREKVGADSTEAFTQMKREMIEKQTGDAGLASYMASMPVSLFTFLEVTIWLGPLLIALLGFDAISGELQHRSVRFWTVRSRRWSYYAGKLFGLWALVGLVTLVLNVIAGSVALVKGYVTVGQLLSWGTRFWLVALLIAGAWAAIGTFISSCFKQPILALLTTFVTFFVLWLVDIGGFIARTKATIDTGMTQQMSWYEYLYPNGYDTMLLSPQPGKVLTAAAILLAFVAASVAGGSYLFSKRDI